LDHDGECKKEMLEYMLCIAKEHNQNSKCRDQAKEYLELALKVQPSFATALENLGDVYTGLASKSYGKAVQLDRRLVDSRRKMKLAEDILK
jgi:hypothetical protein